MSDRLTVLELRVAKLEAREEIRDLKARYARACDNNFDPVAMQAFFTEDAIYQPGEYGTVQGRDAICAHYATVPRMVTWCLHFMHTSMLEVDDDLEHATGSWCFDVPCTMEGEPVWMMGTYDDEYRKEDGVWRFARVHVRIETMTPFDKGWVEQRFVTA
jgi:ketosteroid isomerase-like protein